MGSDKFDVDVRITDKMGEEANYELSARVAKGVGPTILPNCLLSWHLRQLIESGIPDN